MVNIFRLQSYKCYHGDPITTRGLSVDNIKLCGQFQKSQI